MTGAPKWLCFILLSGLLAAACGKAVAPPDVTKPPVKEGQPVAQADWEQRWNAALVEGRKESTVAIYSSWAPEVKTSVTAAFKSKYGIGLEFTPYNRSTELLAKVLAEQRAGLFNADVFGAGLSTLLLNMKPENLLGSLKPVLILPEVLDAKGWRAGKVPFTDDQALGISLIGVLTRSVVYNTGLVKERDITSYEDLLKPQYKGKITLNDPSVTGPGNGVITHLGYSLWGEAFAHPNATAVFVNWLLTKEGQTVFARSFGNPSTRADVSVEGIDPMFVPAPGETYYLETEDAMQARVRWLDLAKKVMDEAGK